MAKYKVASGKSLFVATDEGGKVLNEGQVVEIQDEAKAQEYLDRGTLVAEDTDVQTGGPNEFERAQQEAATRQPSENLPGQAPEDQGEGSDQVVTEPTQEQLAQDFEQTAASTSTSGPVNQ